MLDDLLLQDFIQGFRGYGTFEAPWWFVGMEEGGGNDEAEIARRLSAWDKRGRLELDDVAEFHREFGVSKFWKKNPPTQPTWRKLIRLMLAATMKQASEITLKQIREYQRDHWGRTESETCLLELLPLPSPDSEVWQYDAWSEICQLADRDSYREWMIPSRIEFIRRRIEKYRPKIVVFYGKEYLKYWQEIASVASWTDDSNGFSICESAGTKFVAVPHPASEWANSFWTNIGRRLV